MLGMKNHRSTEGLALRSMSGSLCEAVDKLTWKELDRDWSLSTIEAFCKQHMERL